jgi:protein tyrosine phosphatase (PTP) superfamily phosphohydrolase (DUF442 family)
MKKFLKLLGLSLVLFLAYYYWFNHINYRFKAVKENEVYKSALINPDRLESFLLKNNIKTVIDLLDPGVQDALNPAKQAEIDAEDSAVKAINEKHGTNINHINIPSGQVPSKKTLTKFFEVLDNKDNYPVLIHCYHGTGRAEIYSAIYNIEYQKLSNADARKQTRFVVEGFGYRSSFADGKEKGDFLMNYKPRSMGEASTLSTLEK